MSAKKYSQAAAKKSAPPAAAVAPASSPAVPAADGEANVAWIDSADPRRRMFGKIALVAVWIYVAALLLLALDQTFHWGIFGPAVPPVP